MEGIASLGVNLPTLIAQVITFILFFLLLKKYAFKPVMKMMDDRAGKIRESVEQVEAINDQAAKAEEEYKRQISQAVKEGQEITARAARAGEEMRLKAQEDARKDAESLINRAQVEIQRERDEVIEQLRREFADLTVLAAGKVIEQSLDEKAHRQIIDQTLEESADLMKGRLN